MIDTVQMYPLLAQVSGGPALSRLLLDLYLRVLDARGASLEACLFDWLPAHLHVDAAWLGHSTFTDVGPVMHASMLHALPEDYTDDWLSIRDEDPTVRLLPALRGEPIRLSMNDPRLSRNMRGFLRRHGVTEVMCNMVADPALKAVMHLSLYRRGNSAPFSEEDADLFRGAMPHLAAAATMSRVYRARLQEVPGATRPPYLAVCNPLGVLQYAEPAFVESMQLEWPEWPGVALPNVLLRAAAHGVVSGRQACFHLEATKAALVVRAYPRTPLDQLSPQERRVVELFGAGNSYKAVARELQLAPATVRHYLRQAYAKLDIRSKSEVVRLLGPGTTCTAPSP